MNHSTLRRAALALAALGLAGAPAAPAVATRVACQEDMPCWNWANMGDHHRGIVSMHGTALVVGPCRFKKLMQSGMLDYRYSDIMRGDALAMRLSCSAH